MKLNEYQNMQIVNFTLYMIFFSILLLGIYLENLLLICGSTFIGLFALLYSLFHREDFYYYSAKNIVKKIKKEDLEAPITKRDIFKGVLLFKLAKRYGKRKGVALDLLLSSLIMVLFLAVWFYFTGWPKDVSSLVIYLGLMLFLIYRWQIKIVEEVLIQMEAKEDEK